MKTQLAIIIFFCSLSPLVAHAAPPAPHLHDVAKSPELLLITQEAVKPGKAGQLVKNRAAVSGLIATLSVPKISIALTSISGPEEVWTLDFFDGLGGLQTHRDELDHNAALREKVERLTGQEADLLTHRLAMTALYQKELTYQPDFGWAQVRYLDVITVHVRPGHHLEYGLLRKMSLAGHNKGGLEGPLHVFKINTGTRGLAWMILRPLKSLYAHDELRAKGFGEILTDEEDKKMVELRAASYEYAEERLFRVDPEMSHVPSTWEQPEAPFWRSSSK